MTTKATNVPNEKAERINIRYTPTKRRVKSLLPKHYTGMDKQLKKAGGSGIDNQKLCAAMGITTERLKKILTGGEVTIGEAVKYAEHFGTDMQTLYKPIKG